MSTSRGFTALIKKKKNERIKWKENHPKIWENYCNCRPTGREQIQPSSSGASRMTIASDTTALATALQSALNARVPPTRSQSQPVDLATPLSCVNNQQQHSHSQHQSHQPHAWHSQPSASYKRAEFRSGYVFYGIFNRHSSENWTQKLIRTYVWNLKIRSKTLSTSRDSWDLLR